MNALLLPAGEKTAPADGSWYFVPCVSSETLRTVHCWSGGERDLRVLDRGLVHLNEEDAIAVAGAMLAVVE